MQFGLPTGVGHYARHLLAGIRGTTGGPDLTCFLRWREVAAATAERSGGGSVTGATQFQAARRLAAALPGAACLRNAWRDVQARHSMADSSGAIYHNPNHGMRPVRCARVVTIHDLSLLHTPEMHPAERVRHMGRGLARAALMSDLVITPSQLMKREIVAHLGVPEGRVRVVPMGAGAEFQPGAADTLAGSVLARHGLVAGRYALSLSTREPRKNLGRLLDAYLGLPDELRREYPLVLAGPAGWRAAALERRLGELEMRGEVRRLGYVADADRPALYGGARAFFYPSLYEGFGLPPLEAAASGVPVLTSRGTAMEEVLGSAALLVRPEDVDEIRFAMWRLLTDSGLAQKLAQKGLSRARGYTWERCVAATIDVYRELLPEGEADAKPTIKYSSMFGFSPRPQRL